MANQLEQQLSEAGKKLQQLPHSKDALLKILKQVAINLSEVDQSPSQTMMKAMRPSMNALITPELLRHRDRDVTLLVATCISEITRITAPEAPYNDDVLRDIFHLIVTTFHGLDNINSPSFGRRVTILETVAKIRSCVMMLDLECDDLILEMFHIFFSVASEAHPENLLTSMQTIMTLVLDESEDIPEQLFAVVLASLGREKEDVSPAARRLAMNVMEQCAIKLEPYVIHFITSAMSAEEDSQNNLQTTYHEIIYDIYQCAPQMLQSVIPNMTHELLTDQLDVRLKSVKLLGRLFAMPGHPLPEVFRPLFLEFLKRFTDKDVEVRLSIVEHAKECLLSNPFRHEAADIISALNDRLLDYDENVRKQVVAAICDVASYALKSIPMETIKRVADRLRDKMVSVRKYTLERLADIYRVYCLKCSDGSFIDYEFEWIPRKIIMCCYDKDFRPQAIEMVFSESLFPSDLSVVERVKHWIMMYSELEKFEIKAFEVVLAQKQRLQQEMQSYLLLRQKLKDDNELNFEKQILSCFKTMSLSFKDPAKAEENFQTLHQMKDIIIWKALACLIDPSRTFVQAQATYIDMLERLGDKHPQHEFIKTLASKCSYRLFGKEHVKEMLKEIAVNKLAGKDELIQSGMNLLVLFAGFFPCLVKGSEEDLLQLLKEDNECIKEGVVHILAKVGGSIGEQVTDTTSSVDLLLETLCLEGNRKQAKYAVQALAVVTKDAGLKALSVLYKRLVDMLESGTHLPAILQSLGCIAQNAMPVFETREDDVIQFLCDKLFRQNSNTADFLKTEWEERSKECLLKIYGIKTLVKSYLPKKDAHLRQRIKTLFVVLSKLLTCGEISEDVESSEVDKAHIRLAAAKGLLRLSKQWDAQITPELFHLTLRIAQDTYPEVRKEFLGKVHQYLKEQTLDQKYACAFVLGVSGETEDALVEVRQYLVDFVETCRREAQLQQPYAQSGGNSITFFPEYVLAYLVHVLAHHPEFPALTGDLHSEAIGSLYRQLHFFLSVLVHRDEDVHHDPGTKREYESFAIIEAIFQSIKHAEDAVEKSKSENLYALCDLGLSITKELVQDLVPSSDYSMPISLPAVLYKPLDESKEIDIQADARHLTAGLAGSHVFAHYKASNMEQTAQLTPNQKTKIDIDENVAKESDEDDLEVPLRKMMRCAKLQGIRKQNNLGVRRPREASGLLKGCSKETSNMLLMVTGIQSEKASKSPESNKPSGKVSNGIKITTRDDVPEKDIVDNPVSSDMEMLISTKRKRSRSTKYTEDFIGSGLCHSKPGRPKGSIKKPDLKSGGSQGLTMLKTEAEPAGLNGAEFKLSELSSSPKSEQSKVSPAQLSALDANKFFLSKNSQKLRSGTSNVLRENVSPEARQEMHEHKKEKSIARPESTTKALGDSLRSPIGTSRKTLKKKSISVLQKSSEKAKKRNIDYGKLTGYRIKVWWPLDMQFYEGIVESYDSIQKKHRILYDDGDVEILKLQKERWELIDCDLITEKQVSIHVEGSKSAGDKPRIKGADIGDIGILEEEKTQSSQNRRAPFKISKKSTPQSCVKPDDNGVCAKSTEVDTSRRKAQDPFVFIDDKDRKSRGKGRKQLLGSEGKRGGHFTISRKITSGTMENSKTRSSTTDEDNQGSLSDSGSRDSDDEPLNTWWSRKKNEAVKYMGQDLSLVQ